MNRMPPLYVQIIVGMILGVLVGMGGGPTVAPLGEVGKAVITLIKALATPLLATTIVHAFVKAEMRMKSGFKMVAISAVNGSIAVAVGLAISNWLRPGDYLRALATNAASKPIASVNPALATAGTKKIEWIQALVGHIPSSVVTPFAENSVIAVVLLAVLFGVALRKVKNEVPTHEFAPVDAGLEVIHRTVERVIGWVVKLVPLAVFSVVAKTVGEYGFAPLEGLMVYLAVGLVGLSIQVVFVYHAWILVIARAGFARFWSHAREAVVHALGASSSLATLPLTLKGLDRLEVSRESSRLAACVGTNLNNDGILLYEAMAALLVAQAYGIDLSLAQQLGVALSCVIAGVGIAGVPEAGLISLALVLTTAGLPLELLPVLLSVDWILSRARAATNVIADFTTALVLDRWSGHGKHPRTVV